MTLTLVERRAARKGAGAHVSMPVRVVEGDATVEPKVVGRSYYWTTPSGKTEVRHPNAYKWPVRYWPSTLRVEVTRSWLFVNQVQALGEAS